MAKKGHGRESKKKNGESGEGRVGRGKEEGRDGRRVVGGGDRGRRIIRLGELSLSGPS